MHLCKLLVSQGNPTRICSDLCKKYLQIRHKTLLNKLHMYTVRTLDKADLSMNGDTNLDKMSAPANDDISIATCPVSKPKSFSMNGFISEKFRSLMKANESPMDMFTYTGSLSKSRSKKFTICSHLVFWRFSILLFGSCVGGLKKTGQISGC